MNPMIFDRWRPEPLPPRWWDPGVVAELRQQAHELAEIRCAVARNLATSQSDQDLADVLVLPGHRRMPEITVSEQEYDVARRYATRVG